MPFSNEIESGVLHHVAFQRDSATDTIPNLLTDRLPTLVGETLLVGLIRGPDGEVDSAFRYAIPQHRLETEHLPPDLSPGVTGVAFSPDGRHLAYVSFSVLPGLGVGIVRRWPGGTRVLQTPGVPVAPSDVLSGDVRWVSATELKVAILPDRSDGTLWIQFTADLRTGALTRDTLAPSLLPQANARGQADTPTTKVCPSKPPRFADYPADSVYRGRPAAVDFSSDPDAREYRTVLTAGAARGPNFAGHYTVVEWESLPISHHPGCQRTGRILTSTSSSLGAAYRLDSRLFTANPMDSTGCYDPRCAYCQPVYYIWNGFGLDSSR